MYGRIAKHQGEILKRLAKGETLVAVAKDYGCCYQAIQRIRNYAKKGRGHCWAY